LKRAKIGEEPLAVFKISTAPSTFNKCKQKCSTPEKAMEIATFLLIVAGQFNLLFYILADECFLDIPSSFPTPFKDCP
jgi:hypothetical protein